MYLFRQVSVVIFKTDHYVDLQSNGQELYKIKIDQLIEFSKLNLKIYIMTVFLFVRDKLFISKDRQKS